MIIPINKSKGATSHDVVDVIRKKLGVKKVGHTGTLDPMAEGVLIILTGEDTKRQSEFMNMEKEYIAEIVFGVESDTYDLDSPNIRFQDKKPTIRNKKEKLIQILKSFVGEVKQEVPPYSAVKIKGKPLYTYARRGLIKTPLPQRKILIKKLELLEIGEIFVLLSRQQYNIKRQKYPYIKIKVICSKGTYIRSLAIDIGKKLGCVAVLSSLTRTRIGAYTLEGCSKYATNCL